MEPLDIIDLKILQILAVDGRVSWQELADHVGIPLAVALRRIKCLEDEKYILGYAAIVNEPALGRPINAVVHIELERQSKDMCELFEEQIVTVPALRFCGKMTGKPDYVANIMAKDMDDYNEIICDISAITGVSRVRSNLVLKQVRPYGPPRPANNF